MNLSDHLVEHPVDRDRVDVHKARMLAETGGHRLRELREHFGLTQVQLAEQIGIGHRMISRIEHGDLEDVRLGTLRAYIGALNAELSVNSVLGDRRTRIA